MARSFNRRTTRVSGLKELEKVLSGLPKSVAKTTCRRTLKLAAAPIAEVATELAPVRTGELKSEIKIDTRLPKNYDQSKVAYAKVLRSTGDRAAARAALRAARRENPATFAQVFIGPSVAAWYGHFPEFGTADTAPQPFMRPAWDQKQDEALEIIVANLGPEIQKSAARHAKRQARLAARRAR